MVEGIESDDRYRMVEDEFLSTASLFTAHLHAAEYQRLKDLAKSQNADTIRNISRPVVGNMTDIARRRQETLKRFADQRNGLKRSLANLNPHGSDESDDGDLPWLGTALQSLMDSPRKKAIPLTSLTSTLAGTRAAAGFHERSPSMPSRFGLGVASSRPRASSPTRHASTKPHPTHEPDGTDDLGAPSRFVPRKAATMPLSLSSRPCRPSRPDTSDSRVLKPSVVASTKTWPSTHQITSKPSVESPAMDSLSDDLDDGDFIKRIRERRQQQRSRRPGKEDKKKEQKDETGDIIPLF
jgi:hypothetical protein